MRNIVRTHYDSDSVHFYLHAHALIRAWFMFDMNIDALHCQKTGRTDIRTRGFFNEWCVAAATTLGDMNSLDDFAKMSEYFPHDTQAADDMIVKWGSICKTMEDLCVVWKRAFGDAETPAIKEKRCRVIFGFMKQNAVSAKTAKMAHLALRESAQCGPYWDFTNEIEEIWKSLLPKELEKAKTLELAKELAQNCPDDDRFASPLLRFEELSMDHWVNLWNAEAKNAKKSDVERLLKLRPSNGRTEPLLKKLRALQDKA